jgi:GNAT superfamily N-acetyltransferase
MTIGGSSEQLENGSRRTTPAGDNVLRDFALAESDAYATVVRAAGGVVESVDALGLRLSDARSPCPFGNIAHLVRPIADGEAAQLVDAMRAFYGGSDGGAFLLFSPWPTPDLAAHGLTLGGHPPMMVRPAGAAPAAPDSLRIEPVTTPEGLADFERTIVEAFPMVELSPYGSQPAFFGEALLESDWTLYVGYDADRPVATAGAYTTDQLVAVEMVSTRDDCRGQGYGAAITAAAATTHPDRPSALVSSDLGRGVYERLGYLPILRYTLWIGTRETTV